MGTSEKPIYKRILLKLSGEALAGKTGFGIDASVLNRILSEIEILHKMNVQIGIVIGGGNMFRGATTTGIDRITGDQLGMLATVMNGLAMRDVMQRRGIETRVMSSFAIAGIVDRFDHLKAIRHLNKQRIMIFCGGTGNPLFTTDSAASMRAIEIQADVLLKASNVDGVYSDDPNKNPSAKLFHRLTYKEALEQELGVMDLCAFKQCKEHKMPIRVFNIHKEKALIDVVLREDEGTLVTMGDK